MLAVLLSSSDPKARVQPRQFERSKDLCVGLTLSFVPEWLKQGCRSDIRCGVYLISVPRSAISSTPGHNFFMKISHTSGRRDIA